MQINPNGKIQLVFANVLANLFVPLMFKNPDGILAWNKKVNEYIIGVFDFAHMFLTSDCAILLFQSNDFKVLKEVKSYLESYGF